MLILLFILLLAVSIVFSMLGLGGGVLFTPIQVWAGIEFHTAAATSLFLMMVVSVSASLVFRQARRIDWPLALLLESVTMIGGFLGGLYSARLSGPALSGLFAAVVLLAGMLMIRPVSQGEGARPRRPAGGGRPLVWQRQVGDQHYQVHLGIALPLSVVAGVVSGMVGVGGGLLKIPLMVLLLGVPLDIAIGSSAMMVGLTAAAGFAGHVVNGHWDWESSLVLAAAVFVGAQVGSRISVRLDKRRLKRGFGWFLLLVAALMLARLYWTV